MGSPETCADDSSGGAAGGVNLSGLVDTALENLSGLNISMEHVVNYGGPSGKVSWQFTECWGCCPLAALRIRSYLFSGHQRPYCNRFHATARVFRSSPTERPCWLPSAALSSWSVSR